MNRTSKVVLLCAGSFALAACPSREVNTVSTTTPGLANYISGKGYQPLKVARAKWGPGTVVSFDKKGNENIVMFNEQCLSLADSDVQVSPTALPTISYSNDRTIGADVGLDKGFSPDVDVSGAFKDQRVKRIEVKVGKAQQQVASVYTVTSRIKSLLANNSACAQALLQKGNYVINDAMVLGETTFSFKGTDESTVNLDASLLKALNISGDFAQKLAGQSDLPISEPMIVGYKLYKIDAKLGAAGSDIVATPLNSSQIQALKAAQ